MIEFLIGNIIHKEPTHAVIDVNGVGYGIDIPLSTYQALSEKEGKVSVYTYTYVREDALKLFGFATKIEKDIFTVLLSTSGIGPKLAMGILSSCKPADFASAVRREDLTFLTKIPGIGKKSAEKLLFDLKEKMLRFVGAEEAEETGVPIAADNVNDAVDALIALGCPRQTAVKAVRKAINILGDDANIEDLIKEGLRQR